MLGSVLAFFLSPLLGLIVRFVPVKDPWERLRAAPGLQRYGSGARLEFDEYLKGLSTVNVASVEDIKDWLLECRYESDETLFAEKDFWQHPATFERMRAGDCEDYALWGWRKLIELGVDATFVAGYCLRDGELDGRHAWILFRDAGVDYVFEPACATKEKMIRPLSEVRADYIPQFGTDHRGKRFAFTGYLLSERKRHTVNASRRTA
jgi:hypothetical protein